MPSGHIGSDGERPCFPYCLPRCSHCNWLVTRFRDNCSSNSRKNLTWTRATSMTRWRKSILFTLQHLSPPPLSLLSSPLRFSFRLLPPFIPFPCLLPFPALLTTYSSLHSPCSRFSHHLCFLFFTSPPLPHVSLVQSPPPTQLSQSEGFTCLEHLNR